MPAFRLPDRTKIIDPNHLALASGYSSRVSHSVPLVYKRIDQSDH
jgi:hypothetical protein